MKDIEAFVNQLADRTENEAKGIVSPADVGATESLSDVALGTGRAVVEGALPVTDELEGGYRALLAKISGDDRDIADIYKEEANKSLENYKKFKELHPNLSTAGEVAGAIGSAIVPFGAASKALTASKIGGKMFTLPNIAAASAKGAAVGAGLAGIQAAGSSENRLRDPGGTAALAQDVVGSLPLTDEGGVIGTGALGGAGTGAALGAVGQTLSAFANSVGGTAWGKKIGDVYEYAKTKSPFQMKTSEEALGNFLDKSKKLGTELAEDRKTAGAVWGELASKPIDLTGTYSLKKRALELAERTGDLLAHPEEKNFLNAFRSMITPEEIRYALKANIDGLPKFKSDKIIKNLPKIEEAANRVSEDELMKMFSELLSLDPLESGAPRRLARLFKNNTRTIDDVYKSRIRDSARAALDNRDTNAEIRKLAKETLDFLDSRIKEQAPEFSNFRNLYVDQMRSTTDPIMDSAGMRSIYEYRPSDAQEKIQEALAKTTKDLGSDKILSPSHYIFKGIDEQLPSLSDKFKSFTESDSLEKIKDTLQNTEAGKKYLEMIEKYKKPEAMLKDIRGSMEEMSLLRQTADADPLHAYMSAKGTPHGTFGRFDTKLAAIAGAGSQTTIAKAAALPINAPDHILSGVASATAKIPGLRTLSEKLTEALQTSNSKLKAQALFALWQHPEAREAFREVEEVGYGQ